MNESTTPLDSSRPTLGRDLDLEPIQAFARELQTAIDTGDAKLFNRRFAQDVYRTAPTGA